MLSSLVIIAVECNRNTEMHTKYSNYRVYSGEFVKKSVRQANMYVSGKLNNVFKTYTRDSSNFKNLFG